MLCAHFSSEMLCLSGLRNALLESHRLYKISAVFGRGATLSSLRLLLQGRCVTTGSSWLPPPVSPALSATRKQQIEQGFRSKLLVTPRSVSRWFEYFCIPMPIGLEIGRRDVLHPLS